MLADNKLPLWRELNEKRVKGDFVINENYKRELKQNNELVLVCAAPSEDNNAEINAEYAAIAINNFQSVVEALSNMLAIVSEHLPLGSDPKLMDKFKQFQNAYAVINRIS